MKILFYMLSFPPKVDGITTRAINTLRELAKRGHEICIITPQPNPKPPAWCQDYPIQVHSVPAFSLPMYKDVKLGNPFSPRAIWRTRRLITQFNPDIIHLMGPCVFHFTFLMTQPFKSRKIVCSYHTDLKYYTKQYHVPWAFVNFLQTGYRSRFVQRMIVTSQSFKDILNSDHKIPCNDVWPKAIDTETFHPDKYCHQMRQTITQGHPEKFVFIYSGRFADEKDIPHLCDLIKLVPNARLALIGDGPAKKKIKKHLHDRVFVSDGFWSQDKLAQAYASSDAIISASESETLGFSVLEGAVCGKPMVTPFAQGFKDFVKDGVNGLIFDKQDMQKAARQLGAFIDDQAARERMCAEALKIRPLYSWGKATDWLETLYDDVVSDKNPSVKETIV